MTKIRWRLEAVLLIGSDWHNFFRFYNVFRVCTFAAILFSKY